MAAYPRPEVHIAPMLDVSTREFRMLHRILSKKSILWTEMFVDQAVLNHVDQAEYLGLESEEHGAPDTDDESSEGEEGRVGSGEGGKGGGLRSHCS